MKKKNISWSITICINIALITFFSLLFIAVNGMVEKTDDQISGLKSEKKIISENILVKQREREKLWSQIEVSAMESIGMIGVSEQ
tara:strand:+ start:113 stop:367 length:255 start_codon:yes stop_codon:yes gene_type:complete